MDWHLLGVIGSGLAACYALWRVGCAAIEAGSSPWE